MGSQDGRIRDFQHGDRKSRKWGYGTPSLHGLFMASTWGVILSTGSNWDDPPSSPKGGTGKLFVKFLLLLRKWAKGSSEKKCGSYQ